MQNFRTSLTATVGTTLATFAISWLCVAQLGTRGLIVATTLGLFVKLGSNLILLKRGG